MRNSFSSSTTTTTRCGEASSSASSSSSATASLSSTNPSPSCARRRALKEADAANQLRVVDSYPLSKYMIIAQRLLGYFQQAFENLNLDEAYVYGMRFAELGLKNLPKHREWTTGGNAEKNLKSQTAKVLSRLEIIKQRMDEEESTKLRVRMLARAEEEIRKQNQFHREQRERGQSEVEAMEEFASSNESNSSISHQANTDNGSHSVGTWRRYQNRQIVRKLIGIQRKNKGAAAKSKTTTIPAADNIEKSALPTERSSPVVSQPILPSLSAIRQSRAKHELQGNKAKPAVVEPTPTTHYKIEQYPMVEEVTLRLQSMQTSSLLNLRYIQDPFDHTIEESKTQQQKSVEIREEDNKKERTIYLPAMEGSVSLPLPSQTTFITTVSSHTTKSMPRKSDNKKIETVCTNDEATNTVTRDTIETEKRALNDTDIVSKHVEDIDSSSSFSSSASSEIVDTKDRILAGIEHRLLSSHSEDDLNRYELVLNELRKTSFCFRLLMLFVVKKRPVTSMYTGHHDTLEPSCENGTRSIEKAEHADAYLHTEVFENATKPTMFVNSKILPGGSEIVRDQGSVTNKGTKNETLLNSFDAFDVFLSTKKIQIDGEEESYTEFTVIEGEETGDTELTKPIVEEDVVEEDSYMEYIIEEDVEDEESYMEYTVVEESVHPSDMKKVEAVNASNYLSSSPTCVGIEKNVSPYKPCSRPASQIPELELQNENFYQFPTMNIAVPPAIDDDNMTYITLEDIDTASQGSPEHSKQRIKAILHKDLWKRDVTIVEVAMKELDEVVNNGASSRAHVAEYGGVMAIIRTMIRFPDNESIQFLCCATLGQLASEPETQAMINDMDAVPLISRSMTDHPGSQRIQDAARATIATVYSR